MVFHNLRRRMEKYTGRHMSLRAEKYAVQQMWHSTERHVRRYAPRSVGRNWKAITATLLIALLLLPQIFVDTKRIGRAASPPQQHGIVLILAEDDLFQVPALAEKILQYAEDAQSVLPFSLARILKVPSSIEPIQLAQTIESLYRQEYPGQNKSEYLLGVILIGEVPLPLVKKKDREFISLLPYTDFDHRAYSYDWSQERFVYQDGSPQPQADIWHGVIRPPVERGDSIYAEYLLRFFARNHDFHTENLSYRKRLFYHDEPGSEDSFRETALANYYQRLEYWHELSWRLTDILDLSQWGNQEDPSLPNVESTYGKLNLSENPDEVTFWGKQNRDQDLIKNLERLKENAVESVLNSYDGVFSGLAKRLSGWVENTGRWSGDEVSTIASKIAEMDAHARQTIQEYNKKINDAILKDLRQDVVWKAENIVGSNWEQNTPQRFGGKLTELAADVIVPTLNPAREDAGVPVDGTRMSSIKVMYKKSEELPSSVTLSTSRGPMNGQIHFNSGEYLELANPADAEGAFHAARHHVLSYPDFFDTRNINDIDQRLEQLETEINAYIPARARAAFKDYIYQAIDRVCSYNPNGAKAAIHSVFARGGNGWKSVSATCPTKLIVELVIMGHPLTKPVPTSGAGEVLHFNFDTFLSSVYTPVQPLSLRTILSAKDRSALEDALFWRGLDLAGKQQKVQSEFAWSKDTYEGLQLIADGTASSLKLKVKDLDLGISCPIKTFARTVCQEQIIESELEINGDVIRSSPPKVLFSAILGAPMGDLQSNDSLAQWWLFTDNSLSQAVLANTAASKIQTSETEVGSRFVSSDDALTSQGVGFLQDHRYWRYFASGMPIGEALRAYTHEAEILLGDPTIRLKVDDTSNPVGLDGFDSSLGELIAALSESPKAIAKLDANSDRLPDIAVAGDNNVVRLFLNGNGPKRLHSFGEIFYVPEGIVSMTSGDWENDGAHDLVIATKDPSRLLLFANHNSNWSRHDLMLDVANRIDMVASLDSNNDGKTDLAVTGSDGHLMVFYNQGDDGTRFALSPVASELAGERINPNEELAHEVTTSFDGLVNVTASIVIPINTDQSEEADVLIEALNSDGSVPSGNVVFKTVSREIVLDPALQAILNKQDPTTADAENAAAMAQAAIPQTREVSQEFGGRLTSGRVIIRNIQTKTLENLTRAELVLNGRLLPVIVTVVERMDNTTAQAVTVLPDTPEINNSDWQVTLTHGGSSYIANASNRQASYTARWGKAQDYKVRISKVANYRTKATVIFSGGSNPDVVVNVTDRYGMVAVEQVTVRLTVETATAKKTQTKIATNGVASFSVPATFFKGADYQVLAEVVGGGGSRASSAPAPLVLPQTKELANSSKRRVDLNGSTLDIGDIVETTIRLRNSSTSHLVGIDLQDGIPDFLEPLYKAGHYEGRVDENANLVLGVDNEFIEQWRQAIGSDAIFPSVPARIVNDDADFFTADPGVKLQDLIKHDENKAIITNNDTLRLLGANNRVLGRILRDGQINLQHGYRWLRDPANPQIKIIKDKTGNDLFRINFVGRPLQFELRMDRPDLEIGAVRIDEETQELTLEIYSRDNLGIKTRDKLGFSVVPLLGAPRDSKFDIDVGLRQVTLKEFDLSSGQELELRYLAKVIKTPEVRVSVCNGQAIRQRINPETGGVDNDGDGVDESMAVAGSAAAAAAGLSMSNYCQGAPKAAGTSSCPLNSKESSIIPFSECMPICLSVAVISPYPKLCIAPCITSVGGAATVGVCMSPATCIQAPVPIPGAGGSSSSCPAIKPAGSKAGRSGGMEGSPEFPSFGFGIGIFISELLKALWSFISDVPQLEIKLPAIPEFGKINLDIDFENLGQMASFISSLPFVRVKNKPIKIVYPELSSAELARVKDRISKYPGKLKDGVLPALGSIMDGVADLEKKVNDQLQKLDDLKDLALSKISKLTPEQIIERLKINGLSLDQYIKQIESKIAEARQQIQAISSRLDELNQLIDRVRGMPGHIESELSKLEAQLSASITCNVSEYLKSLEQYRDKLFSLKQKLEQALEALNKVRDLEFVVTAKINGLKEYFVKLDEIEQALKDAQDAMEKLKDFTINIDDLIDSRELKESLQRLEQALESIKNYPEKIQKFVEAEKKYLKQIIDLVKTIQQFQEGVLKKNIEAIKKWTDFKKALTSMLEPIQRLINVIKSFLDGCDTCQDFRSTNSALINLLKLLGGVLSFPQIPIPKMPNFVVDLSMVGAELVIGFPSVEFVGKELYFPPLPEIKLSGPDVRQMAERIEFNLLDDVTSQLEGIELPEFAFNLPQPELRIDLDLSFPLPQVPSLPGLPPDYDSHEDINKSLSQGYSKDICADYLPPLQLPPVPELPSAPLIEFKHAFDLGTYQLPSVESLKLPQLPDVEGELNKLKQIPQVVLPALPDLPKLPELPELPDAPTFSLPEIPTIPAPPALPVINIPVGPVEKILDIFCLFLGAIPVHPESMFRDQAITLTTPRGQPLAISLGNIIAIPQITGLDALHNDIVVKVPINLPAEIDVLTEVARQAAASINSVTESIVNSIDNMGTVSDINLGPQSYLPKWLQAEMAQAAEECPVIEQLRTIAHLQEKGDRFDYIMLDLDQDGDQDMVFYQGRDLLVKYNKKHAAQPVYFPLSQDRLFLNDIVGNKLSSPNLVEAVRHDRFASSVRWVQPWNEAAGVVSTNTNVNSNSVPNFNSAGAFSGYQLSICPIGSDVPLIQALYHGREQGEPQEAILNIDRGRIKRLQDGVWARIDSGAIIQDGDIINLSNNPQIKLGINDEEFKINDAGNLLLRFLGKKEKVQTKLRLSNGNYWLHIRAYASDGSVGLPSNIVLLAPQLFADRKSPHPDIEASPDNPMIFNEAGLSGASSTDDGAIDSKQPFFSKFVLFNEQAEPNPTMSYLWDLDGIEDASLDGFVRNDVDRTGEQIIYIPQTRGDKKLALLAIDEAGNRAEQSAYKTLSIQLPEISLAGKNITRGELSGETEPNIRLYLMRNRGERTQEIIREIASDDDGNFKLTDLVIGKAILELFDAAGQRVMTINPDGGIAELVPGFRVNVVPSQRDDLPVYFKVVQESTGVETAYFAYDIDKNIDVKGYASAAGLILSASLKEGVYVVDIIDDEYVLKNVSGGIAVLDSGDKEIVKISNGGAISLRDNSLALAFFPASGSEAREGMRLIRQGRELAKIYLVPDSAKPVHLMSWREDISALALMDPGVTLFELYGSEFKAKFLADLMPGDAIFAAITDVDGNIVSSSRKITVP